MSTAVSVPDRIRSLTSALVRGPWQLLARDRFRGPVIAVVTVLEFLVFNPSGDAVLHGPVALALSLLVAAFVVVVRRHFPVVALVAAALGASTLPPGLTLLAFACYGVGYRVVRLGVTVAAIGLVMLAHIGLWLRGGSPWSVESAAVVGVMALLFLVPALFGRFHRQRAALVVSGWERAERLELERAMTIEQARLRERTRIAQEMHDSLGHDLSLITLQAGALELDPELPERHRETAQALRATTTEAMERLRDVIGVLREERDAAAAPTQPADEDLEALVGRAGGSGVDVRLEQSLAEDGLSKPSPMADRAVYHVVREAITNATKHAPGTPIAVRVRRTAEATTAVVENPISSVPSDEAPSGTGLISLTERMRLVGGELSTSTANGTFTLTATVPNQDSPADELSTAVVPVRSLPKYHPSVDELTDLYERTAPVGRLRRRLWVWLVAPMAVVVIGFLLIVTYVGMDRSTLPAETYASLQVGAPQAEVESVLPTVQQSPPDLNGPEPDRPENAACRYYAPRLDDWMWPDFSRTYRICFVDGRLVSTDVLNHPESPRTSHQAGAAPGDREGAV